MDGAAALSRGHARAGHQARAHDAAQDTGQDTGQTRPVPEAGGGHPHVRPVGIGAALPRPAAEFGSRSVTRAQIRHDAPDAMARLRAALGPAPLDLALLFATPRTPARALAEAAARAFGETTVMGCTTAGEIGAGGYAEGEIVAMGFPRARFRSVVVPIEGLSRLDARATAMAVAAARARLGAAAPDLPEAFAFLLVDGLSTAEDALAAAIATGLAGGLSGGLAGSLSGGPPLPLVGGSAGDGGRYESTFVIEGGRAMSDAAALAILRTDCRTRVFHTDHLVPTETRMVVTGADPGRRVVTEINAEPAASEYARLLGRTRADLTAYTFAAHPLVVRAGGRHHVRAIQRIEGDDLVFFSAIDEGLVLTLAETVDMAGHLAGEMAALSRGGAPDAILACDCLLRRVEAEQRQLGATMSAILVRHRVLGFSTYGEQRGGMHVNQTLTGVAIYPPEGMADDA